MKRIAECDLDDLCVALDDIGVNIGQLDPMVITPEYLQELYLYLLHMQLLAWKAGKSHRQIIRETNQLLHEGKQVIRTRKRLR